MRNIFNISIISYILFLVLILSGYINYLLYYFMIMTIHEFGHIFFIKLFKYKINKITIYPFGSIIDTNIDLNIKSNKLLLISLGGIIFQFIFNMFLMNNQIIYMNISIILFNLIPIYPLDGYKILLSILERMNSYFKITIITYIISIITLVFFFIVTNNLYMFIFLYIMNINYICDYAHLKNKFLLERYLYKPKYKKNINISNIKKIRKNRYNYINLESEYSYLRRKYELY